VTTVGGIAARCPPSLAVSSCTVLGRACQGCLHPHPVSRRLASRVAEMSGSGSDVFEVYDMIHLLRSLDWVSPYDCFDKFQRPSHDNKVEQPLSFKRTWRPCRCFWPRVHHRRLAAGTSRRPRRSLRSTVAAPPLFTMPFRTRRQHRLNVFGWLVLVVIQAEAADGSEGCLPDGAERAPRRGEHGGIASGWLRGCNA
jgi:hypothetical protein